MVAASAAAVLAGSAEPLNRANKDAARAASFSIAQRLGVADDARHAR
ncbi:MAG: hypothetical protein QOH98_968, partial [Methylobacteriaceae bacterium]|nr:hypothetical protein [Methylobacteriaceae bacterium]